MDQLKAFRFCLRCGSETRNDSNIRECTSCGYRFYINPIPVVSALILSGTEILLTTRAVEPQKGKLDTPGGFMELNETLEQALEREIKEELGVGIQNIEYFNSATDKYLFSGVEDYTLGVNFKVKLASEEFSPADDISDVRYYPLDEVDMTEIGFPSVAKVIELLALNLLH